MPLPIVDLVEIAAHRVWWRTIRRPCARAVRLGRPSGQHRRPGDRRRRRGGASSAVCAASGPGAGVACADLRRRPPTHSLRSGPLSWRRQSRRFRPRRRPLIPARRRSAVMRRDRSGRGSVHGTRRRWWDCLSAGDVSALGPWVTIIAAVSAALSPGLSGAGRPLAEQRARLPVGVPGRLVGVHRLLCRHRLEVLGARTRSTNGVGLPAARPG